MRFPVSKLQYALLGCLAALLFISGCARPPGYKDRYETSETYRQPETPIGETWSSNLNPTYYRRDSQGTVYYIDRWGGMHPIERRERAMNVTDGDTFYLRGYSKPYYADPQGRLYYRTPEGRMYYIDEDYRQSRVNEPTTPMRRGYTPYQPTPGYASCPDIWQRCVSRCDELSRSRDRRACREDCNYERENCDRGGYESGSQYRRGVIDR